MARTPTLFVLYGGEAKQQPADVWEAWAKNIIHYMEQILTETQKLFLENITPLELSEELKVQCDGYIKDIYDISELTDEENPFNGASLVATLCSKGYKPTGKFISWHSGTISLGDISTHLDCYSKQETANLLSKESK